MFKINFAVLLLCAIVCTNALSSMGLGLSNNMNKIKLSKIANPSLLNDPLSGSVLTSNRLDAPFSKMVRTRGGSISDNLKSVMQNTNSISAIFEGVAGGIQNYLVSPWLATPPVTKLFVGLSFLLTSIAAIINENEWPEELHFDIQKTFEEFQIWRPFTSFLHLGPLGLNYLLTLQFVWMYMSQLEQLLLQTPAEYLVMLLFGGISLVGSYLVFDLPTKFLGHNLSAYLVYIWSKIFEGYDVNIMDLFSLKAEYLPWFFAAQTLLLEGELPIMDMIGIGIGYLYYMVKDKSMLVTYPTQLLTKYVFDWPWVKSLYQSFQI